MTAPREFLQVPVEGGGSAEVTCVLVSEIGEPVINLVPVCLHPLKVVIDAAITASHVKVCINRGRSVLAEFHLLHPEPVMDVPCTVYTVASVRLPLRGWFSRMLFFLRYGFTSESVSFNYYWKRAALFYQPREVVLVSVKSGGFERVFPMDLQLRCGGHYLLGLRRSNPAVARLDDANLQLSVADAPFSAREDIYRLGASHRGEAPALTSKLRDTAGGPALPDYVSGFAAVSVVRHMTLGEQELIICKVISEKRIGPKPPALAHLHAMAM
jgi:hypothetical protein